MPRTCSLELHDFSINRFFFLLILIVFFFPSYASLSSIIFFFHRYKLAHNIKQRRVGGLA